VNISRAPVALFAYRRPEHLSRAVASLAANREAADTDLYVFCDGAKHAAEQPAVDAVRRVARAIQGFRSVCLLEQARNLGLAASVIGGVTRVLEERESVIVVEDDLVLSPFFLGFMNDALTCYAGEPRVASVHAYIFPVRRPLPETFFLKGAECWGWATWRRAWRTFNDDADGLLGEIRKRGIEHEFDMDGAYGYTAMLKAQLAGKVDSWSIRWRASCYLAGMLTLYPGRSLVQNLGLDATGTHRDRLSDFDVPLAIDPIHVHPIPLEQSAEARAAYVEFFRSRPRPGFVRRALSAAARLARGG
jgi:hypothetical protein